MSDLIRRSNVIKALKDNMVEMGGDDFSEIGVHSDDIDAVINGILTIEPSIDIVRCKECKYYEAKEDWCYWRDEAITADDFCSYGEREGE